MVQSLHVDIITSQLEPVTFLYEDLKQELVSGVLYFGREGGGVQFIGCNIFPVNYMFVCKWKHVQISVIAYVKGVL